MNTESMALLSMVAVVLISSHRSGKSRDKDSPIILPKLLYHSLPTPGYAPKLHILIHILQLSNCTNSSIF